MTRLVVLQSFPAPRPTTNPYIVMLRDALTAQDEVELWTFSWRRALTGRFDVFHAHWPEILVTGRTPLRALVRQVLFATFYLRMRWRRTAVVRTVHNLELPSGITRRERVLLRLLDRATTLRIALNDATAPPGEPGWIVIPHGHYRDWMAAHPRARQVPGTVAFVGLIRRYKNVAGLVQAFRALPGPYRLEVAGQPSGPDLREEIEAAAQGDERIRLDFRYLGDADLAQLVTSASLVVLPYHHMHNSGGVLMALSLARPVLVPAGEVASRLAREVGPGWVHEYSGDLGADDLRRVLQRVADDPPTGEPDLQARGWQQAGAAHVVAYWEAVSRAAAAPAASRGAGRRYSS